HRLRPQLPSIRQAPRHENVNVTITRSSVRCKVQGPVIRRQERRVFITGRIQNSPRMNRRTPRSISSFFADVDIPLLVVRLVICVLLQLGDEYNSLSIGRQASLKKVGLILETNAQIFQGRPAGCCSVSECKSIIDMEKKAVVVGTDRHEIVGRGCIDRLSKVYTSRPCNSVGGG